MLIRSPRSRWTGGLNGSAESTRGSVASVVVIGSELVEHLDERGYEEHHEDRREDADHEWKQHLDRCLLSLLLGGRPSPRTDLIGLRAQDPRHRHTEGVGLEHRHDEGLEVFYLGAF